MDIVIAAAGKGTRLQSYTNNFPKHILPIAGKPFLYYLLDAINEAGFRRCIIVGGYCFEKMSATIKNYLPAESRTEIILINQFDYVPNTAYGTACPLLAAAHIIQGDRFVYTMGDHLLSTADLQTMQMSTADWLLAAVEHTHPERFGVVAVDAHHHLTQIIEKPAHPTSQLVNVGLYTFTPTIIPQLKNLKTSSRQEYEITDALNIAASHQPIRVVPLTGPWLDLGRPEDIASLEQFVNNSKI
ncbi:MAG: sugar phosphate nucleotidyltransferase [Patescibacteria group bacterium]|jgi:dTDP-glucose pyrophosphorylase